MNAPKPGDVTLPLIVAYTKLAASHYNDIEKDLITLAVEETNQSFRDSGIDNVHIMGLYRPNLTERASVRRQY